MAYQLKPNKGSTFKKTRRGCGRGSGLGKTGGRGTKGQRARTGQNRPYMGFEGGQMPIYRRIPKRGFKHAGVVYSIVNVSQLNQFADNTTVNAELLFSKGLINNTSDKLKVLGNGELTKKVSVEAHKISESAKEKIEKSGGKVKILEG